MLMGDAPPCRDHKAQHFLSTWARPSPSTRSGDLRRRGERRGDRLRLHGRRERRTSRSGRR